MNHGYLGHKISRMDADCLVSVSLAYSTQAGRKASFVAAFVKRALSRLFGFVRGAFAPLVKLTGLVVG
jgi:hypothetical protein